MLCLYIYIYMIWDGFPLPVTMASGGHCSCVGDHLGIWSWSLYPGSRTSSWIRKVPNLGGPAKVSLRIPWVRRIATTCTMKQMASPEALKSHPGRQLQFRVRLIFVHSKMFLKSLPSIITVSLSWLACYCKLQLKQASRIVFLAVVAVVDTVWSNFTDMRLTLHQKLYQENSQKTPQKMVLT